MLSIVVSWRDRGELAMTLPSLLEAVASVGGEVVVVNFGGDQDMLSEQLGTKRHLVEVVEVHTNGYFNKSKAQNLGAAASTNPHIFFCDCDILLDPLSLRELVERVRDTTASFGTLSGVRESEVNSRGGNHVVSFGYTLNIRTADGRSLKIVDSEEDAETGLRNAPGLLLVGREDFLRVNGYNGRLLGWGWEDQDMIGRLTLGAGLTRVFHGNAIHVSHDDKARVAHYPLANRWESRDKMFRQALAFYDSGDFQGTFLGDLAEFRAVSR
jgi:hypothetical protein